MAKFNFIGCIMSAQCLETTWLQTAEVLTLSHSSNSTDDKLIFSYLCQKTRFDISCKLSPFDNNMRRKATISMSEFFPLEVCQIVLTLSTLGKIFSTCQFENFFFYFHRKQDLTFHAKCLQCRQFS